MEQVDISKDVLTNDENEKITFLIENEEIECPKNILLKNSDYFIAMFEGNFLEKNKKIIDLKGVSANVMRDLLAILQERELFFKCEDTYGVLSACGMFLFEELKSWILTQMELRLSLTNCLQMWFELENLEIVPLCWKAKSMSLLNFQELIDNNTVNNLNINELCSYLGHVNLQCNTEFDVFETIVWWYRKHRPSDGLIYWKKLMRCIDFQHTPLDDVVEMKKFLNNDEKQEVVEILDFIIQLKLENNFDEEDNEFLKIAQELIKSNRRFLPKFPCLLIKTNLKDEEQQNSIVYYDKYKRKRLQTVIDNRSIEKLVYYDHVSRSLREFSNFPINKCSNLTGFGMQDYKNKIHIFGGEFSMGKGTWNFEHWSFDLNLQKLEQKQDMPTRRRHFECCVCGTYLYVVGGTGSFRVIQDNMLSFNFKSGKWSKEVVLPCSGKQIKCCNFNKQLFIFSFSDKCGYLYSHFTGLWKKLVIHDPKETIPKTFTLFSIFFYNDNLFLKGDKLIELKMLKTNLKILKITPLPSIYNDDFFETVTCHNFCYTLYKHVTDGQSDRKITLEYLNLDTKEVQYVFEYTSIFDILENGGQVKIASVEKLFLFHHHCLVIDNNFVNVF